MPIMPGGIHTAVYLKIIEAQMVCSFLCSIRNHATRLKTLRMRLYIFVFQQIRIEPEVICYRLQLPNYARQNQIYIVCFSVVDVGVLQIREILN